MYQDENKRKRELERGKRVFEKVSATMVAPTNVSGRKQKEKRAGKR
ncbi:hypothetical protein [Salipaludibacillus aurantiacus]|nr:hypothetical protein [Salipaludibacillus aurantiacus]